MPETFERRLDLALNTRQQRRLQRQAEKANAERAILATHADLERKQTYFGEKVRSLLEDAVERANRHLAARNENCHLCEVSGYYTGPLYVGGSACNPVAFDLLEDGQSVGDTLIVELSHEGMIEAFLGPLRPGDPEAPLTRLDLAWRPVPLYKFNARNASELVLKYVTAMTARFPLDHQATRSWLSSKPESIA